MLVEMPRAASWRNAGQIRGSSEEANRDDIRPRQVFLRDGSKGGMREDSGQLVVTLISHLQWCIHGAGVALLLRSPDINVDVILRS